MEVAVSPVPVIFGKPITVWLGTVVYLGLLTTATLGFIIRHGIAQLPFPWHRNMALTTIGLALVHASFAFYQSFIFKS